MSGYEKKETIVSVVGIVCLTMLLLGGIASCHLAVPKVTRECRETCAKVKYATAVVCECVQ